MKRRITLIILGCLIVSTMLAGCARTPNPSPSPTISPALESPMLSPSPDMSPGLSPGMSPGIGGIGNTGDNMNNAEAARQIKAELDKLSEVDTTSVVVVGNVAIIGLQFTSQYQGGVTERINEMVAEKVKATDERIIDVIITDTPEHFTTIEGLATRTGEAIYDDVTELINRIRNAA